MSEPRQVEGTRRIVVEEKGDPITSWLVWAALFMAVAVVSFVAYALVTGVFTSTTPKTFDEKSLAVSAEIIRRNPQSGAGYAQRAETLFKMGRVDEAYQVLDQGEKAVGDQIPARIYILRARTILLNKQERYAEAEKVGLLAIAACDEYLSAQIKRLAAKNLNTMGADSSLSVDTAIQLADTYVGQKKWGKAVELYSYALKFEPTASDILSLRGSAYAQMSAETSASLDFKEALKFMPDNERALSGLQKLEAK